MSARKSTRNWSRAICEALDTRTLLSLAADANADGHVNALDFNAVAFHFNQTGTSKAHGDFTGDGRTNALDFNVLADEYGSNETMPLTDNTLQPVEGGSDVGIGANWSLGHLPTQSENAVIATGATGNLGTRTIGGLTITDGSGLDWSGVDVTVSGVTVDDGAGGGNVVANNCAGLTLAAVNGNLTGTGNTGGAIWTITSKTGDGTLNIDGDEVIITSLGTSKIAIGSSNAARPRINGASSGSRITFTSTSGILAAIIHSSAVTEVVANKTGGVACPIDLLSSTLNASATLTSQLAGVTVTDDTGGTVGSYLQSIANTDFTVTGGAGSSHAAGSTYSATVNASRRSTGLAFTSFDEGADLVPTNFSYNSSTGALSGTIPANTTPGTYAMAIFDLDHNIYITDTITVTAAATGGPKQNRLRVGIGLGL